MNKHFKNFIKDLQSISLRSEERDALRTDFLNKIEAEPSLIVSPYSYTYVMFRFAKVVAYSVLIFIIGLSPVAFAAQNAEQGDILYPFKEAVNMHIVKTFKKIIHKSESQSPSDQNALEKEGRHEDNDSRDKNKDEEKIKDKVKEPKKYIPAFIPANPNNEIPSLDKKIKDKVSEIIGDAVTPTDQDNEKDDDEPDDEDNTSEDAEQEIQDTADTVKQVIPKVDLSL